jgi:rhamnogalacturonan endolyase
MSHSSAFLSPVGLLILAMCALPARAAAAPAPITVTDAGRTIQLKNGAISLDFNRDNGQITSMRLGNGPELFRRGGSFYFDANGSGPVRGRAAGYWRPSGAEYRLDRPSADMAHLSFSAIGDQTFPFQVSVNYVVKADDPGFYCYVVYEHPKSMAPASLGQTRLVAKLSETLFTHYFVSDKVQGLFPKNPDPAVPLQEVTNATVRFPDGRIATKYNLADYEDKLDVYGATGRPGGVWIISPSREYVNGGPTKQDLCVHEDSVILLRMLQSGHFGAGGISVRGDWSKFYGPFYVYLNSGATPGVMWQDAKRRAAAENAAWPYQWVKDPLYPLERGTVTGRLQSPEGRAYASATVVLGAPTPDWQLQASGYLFWAHAGADGSFSLKNVRPGSYTLFAYCPGFVGELQKADVDVKAGQTTDLGVLHWAPVSYGRLLWQIGTPDRTTLGFRHAGEPRQFGLWNLYLKEFPNDVSFTIGQSKEATDWNYCQAVVMSPDGSWHSPEWRVLFNLQQVPTGRETLLVGIAGAVHNPDLGVFVNGQQAGELRDLGNDASIYRDANLGGHFQLRVVQFDASLLKAGQNILSLRFLNPLPRAGRPEPYPMPQQGIMYDFLRLEAAG